MTFKRRSVAVVLACGMSIVAASPSIAVTYSSDDFASQVISYSYSNSGLYGDPYAALGKPTSWVKDSKPWGGSVPGHPGVDGFAVSLVDPAWNVGLDNSKLLYTVKGELTLAFDTPIYHRANNWYGDDFIVYGNGFFTGSGNVYANTDMDKYNLVGGGWFEKGTVSVSQDGVNWYTYANGPYEDGLYPTQAYKWDSATHTWGDEEDYTKPISPDVKESDFVGISAAKAIGLYDGSAGGTAYDLSASGFDWIKYVRITGNGCEVDGVARVGEKPAQTPEPSAFQFLLGGAGAAQAVFLRLRALRRRSVQS